MGMLLDALIALAVMGVSGGSTDFSWPEGQSVAVSLSYDDALDSQLDYAIPALDGAGLRGSFYLTLSSSVVSERVEEWRAAASRGHELGNHTIFHPCSKRVNEWVKSYHDMDHYVIDEVREEIALANRLLHIIDGRSERTFTIPCGDTQTVEGDYLPAVRDLFVGIKGDPVGLPAGFAVVFVVQDLSGQELIDLVENASNNHRLINVLFHGVGGDYLAVSADAHAELVAYLASNRDRYWTDTYLSIIRHARAAQHKR